MMNYYLHDTIAALATAPGKGAIAIIRMSGEKSFEILSKIFSGSGAVKKSDSGRLVLGKIYSKIENRIIDQVLAAYFKNPNSFTGEDVVEINCHGGPLIVQELLNLLLDNGARIANPGEFTQRAFLNGKMDLLQAESVADAIDSQTRYSLKQSQNQMSGRLSKKMFYLRDDLKKQLSLLEIELDFSEAEIEFASRGELLSSIDSLLLKIDHLLATFQSGKILREGVHLALVGRPNVGKSSILNRLLQEDRAIVSEMPGTTRDVVEESLDIGGVLFKISDTAGLRVTKDAVEKEGVERTKGLLLKADMVLFIVESGNELTIEDREALQIITDTVGDKQVYLLINKSDLRINSIDFSSDFEYNQICEISAKTGEGFSEFTQKLVDHFFTKDIESDFAFINKSRHRNALRRAKESLTHARHSLDQEMSSEYIAMDVRAALDFIGEITGEVTTDDVLNDIFSSFCIGK